MTKKDQKGVTLEVLLEHMQAMDLRITKRLDSLESEMKDGFKQVHIRLDKLEKRVDWLRDNMIEMAQNNEVRFQRMEKAVFAA